VEESRIRQYEFGNRYPRSERDGDGTVFQLDDGLAYHIISNLMDNANKYGGQTIPPSVDLTLRCIDDDTGHSIFDFSSNSAKCIAPGGTSAFLSIHVANEKGKNHGELQQCNSSQLQRLSVKGRQDPFNMPIPRLLQNRTDTDRGS